MIQCFRRELDTVVHLNDIGQAYRLPYRPRSECATSSPRNVVCARSVKHSRVCTSTSEDADLLARGQHILREVHGPVLIPSTGLGRTGRTVAVFRRRGRFGVSDRPSSRLRR